MAGAPSNNRTYGYGSGLSMTLVAPAVLMLSLFFIVPLAGLLQQSFYSPELGTANYVRASGGFYAQILLRTLRISAIVTLSTLILGYPVALLMSRVGKTWSILISFCVLLPLWTSVLVRSYSWIVLLERHGIVNEALIGAALIQTPIRMLYQEGTVVLATIHVLLPFMILSVFGVLRTIPRELTMAASSLGAGARSTFIHVIFPLSLPGVYSGVLMVFIISLGFYITPALLGGPETLLISTLIGQQTTETLDWGLAGALSVILLAVTLVLVALFGRLIRLDGKGA